MPSPKPYLLVTSPYSHHAFTYRIRTLEPQGLIALKYEAWASHFTQFLS